MVPALCRRINVTAVAMNTTKATTKNGWTVTQVTVRFGRRVTLRRSASNPQATTLVTDEAPVGPWFLTANAATCRASSRSSPPGSRKR
jgi:hypothetical protein